MISDKLKRKQSLVSIARLSLLFSLASTLLTTATASTARQARDDSPRELSGMSASTSFNIKDDLPLDTQAETAIAMLYRLKKASPATLDRFAAYTRKVTLTQAQDETIDYRFWLFRFPAKLKKIERVPIVDAPKTSDSIQQLYRCTAEATDASGKPLRCTILTRLVPSELPADTALDEPIDCTGLLYCRALVEPVSQGPATENQPIQTESTPTLVFIAERLAWFPKTEAIADKRMVALAASGFDLSQLDQIKRRNGKPLGGGDSEAFYQMLATVAAQPADQENRLPAVPIKTVIAKSADNIGARVTMTARCRDCTRVEVTDPDKRQRFGVDHYYQLVLFPNLDQSIVLSENTKDGPVKAVYERFPITVCATKLPADVSAEDVEGEVISVDGTFFRIWKYDSEINQRAKTSGTISPLIISREFKIIVTSQWLHHLLSWGLGFVAVCLAFMYAYHRIFKNKQPRPGESILDSLPDQIDVTGLD